MRAAVCSEHGAPEVVRVEDVPAPAVGAGQVRVRVGAAALNYPDALIVANQYQIKVPTPFVPGSEFAGVVAEIGDGVDAFSVGERVSGTGLIGAFAEEVVVDSRALARIPDGIDLRHAAAFGVAYRTAYHVLRSVACVQSGEEVIVLGAGGGVGLATVQLGVLLGASVTAVASSQEKLDVCASYGARHLVDHRSVGLRAALRELLPEGADVVVDPVGGDLSEPALRALRWDGRFVTVGYASGTIPRIPLNLVLLKGISVLGFEMLGFVTHRSDEMRRNDAELQELFVSSRVTPHIGATFALDDVAAALRYLADGRAIGKVVIDVADVEN
jgi:NADPH2:quinone reductase